MAGPDIFFERAQLLRKLTIVDDNPVFPDLPFVSTKRDLTEGIRHELSKDPPNDRYVSLLDGNVILLVSEPLDITSKKTTSVGVALEFDTLNGDIVVMYIDTKSNVYTYNLSDNFDKVRWNTVAKPRKTSEASDTTAP